MAENAEPQGQEQQEKKKPTTREKVLAEIIERLEAAKAAQESASQLRSEAESQTDSEAQKPTIAEAITEKEAKSQLKIVQRLQSGVWQGGIGVGMGAVHGPWFKLRMGEEGKDGEGGEDG